MEVVKNKTAIVILENENNYLEVIKMLVEKNINFTTIATRNGEGRIAEYIIEINKE